jgi:gliding motility-associated-like protein
MKIRLIAVLILCNSFILCSQNLVPNPSFENKKLCPSWSNMNLVNDHLERFCEDWENVGIVKDLSSGGGGQYLHVCGSSSGPYYGSGVPRNYAGFQAANSGNAYVGLRYSGNINNYNSHFYGVKLLQKLVIGRKYSLSFYVSLADSSITTNNNLGMLLSTQKLYVQDRIMSDNYILPNRSHLRCKDTITDKENWIKVAGFLLADSSYEYLTIGNFYNYNNIVSSPKGRGWDHLFYLDDVSIEETNMRIEATDTVVCEGYSTNLMARGLDDFFYWSINKKDTLSSTRSFNFYPKQSSFIYLISLNNIDSIFIEVINPPIKVVPEYIELCEANFETIDANQKDAFAFILDSIEKTAIFNLSFPGTYLLQTMAGNCYRIDTIEVGACNTKLFVPSAFTPNDDGMNDEFLVVGTQIYDFKIQIYNRWGQTVFVSDDLKLGWKGTDAQMGTYFYEITYGNATRTKNFYKKGLIELLR